MRMASRLAALALVAVPSVAFAQSSNFDSFVEDFYGQSFTFDGITFWDVNNLTVTQPDGEVLPPEEIGTELIIERSLTLAADFEQVSVPNTLTFGRAYVVGDNMSLGALSTVTFSPNALAEGVRFDILYYENGPWGGILVKLEAFLEDEVVATQEFTISNLGGRDNVVHQLMEINGVEFDTLKMTATLNGVPTTFRAVFDNMEFTLVGGGCPADFNGDDAVDASDITAFLGAWFADRANGTFNADFNADSAVDASDITAYLSAWFEARSGGC